MTGSLHEVDASVSGGGPVLTAVAGVLAALCLGLAGLCWCGTWRLLTRRGASPVASAAG